MRKQYSDLALMLKAVRKDIKMLRQRTGTRAGSSAAPMTVVSARGDKVQSGADYYSRIEKRLRTRLDYIEERAHVEIDDSIFTSGDLHEIEQQIAQHLRELD